MRVGIALEGMPKLLQGVILDLLNRQPDFTVFTIEKGGEEVLAEAVRSDVLDVLIAVVRDADSAAAPVDLLYARSHLRVLGVQGNGRSGVLFSLQPNAVRMAKVSPTELLAAIRSVASPNDPLSER